MCGALSRLRVLDLTRVLAGPWSTQALADLGADVIKVERPQVGDDTRQWGPPWLAQADASEPRASTYFSSTNRNKRSICIDIAKPQGQQLMRQLAAQADILVENYKVGDLARYGLGYDDLREVNPKLVYCSVTGYGQDGPYAQRPGYDFVFQAEGGLMSINGARDAEPGGGPMKVAIAVTDVLAGLNATIAILAAIEERHHSGQGQHIDIALLDTIVQFGANQIAGWFVTGKVPGRHGNAHPNLAPYQVVHTADQDIVIACGNDAQWRRLCAILDLDEIAHDERFATMPARNARRAEMIALLEQRLRSQPASHWLALMADHEIPSGPINDYAQVFDHPQVKHRGLRVDVPRDGASNATTLIASSVATVASPLRLSRTPVSYRHAPPLLGAHTDDVLSDWLSCDAAQISGLREAGIVA
jgi:crotonobetainyl-CoA:carnitine CoA-transferase CaiB-like acyl-CoA transferase